MVVTYHCNLAQPHQREHGAWLQDGLRRHGLDLNITPDIEADGDVHIVSGPHYARSRWLGHARTIWLDVAHYHEEKTGRWHSMDWVSLGWLRPDGGRSFKAGAGRPAPERAPLKTEGGTIFLADYNGPVLDGVDTVRLHPANQKYDEPLDAALARHRHAVGYQTTALVKAALMGLSFDCRSRQSILYEDDWLELLPYADWHYSEIEAGEAWEHLRHEL